MPLDTFYRAINKVERSLIRTDADEVTYNLHVMLRFDLELELLEGRLRGQGSARGLARAPCRPTSGSRRPMTATAACRTCTGMAAASAAPSRATRSATSWRAVLRRGGQGASRHPARDRDTATFATLHGWLADNIYRHGRKYRPDELVQRATNSPMRMEPYLAYLRAKYGELYRLPEAKGRLMPA